MQHLPQKDASHAHCDRYMYMHRNNKINMNKFLTVKLKFADAFSLLLFQISSNKAKFVSMWQIPRMSGVVILYFLLSIGTSVLISSSKPDSIEANQRQHA